MVKVFIRCLLRSHSHSHACCVHNHMPAAFTFTSINTLIVDFISVCKRNLMKSYYKLQYVYTLTKTYEKKTNIRQKS